MAPKPAWGPNTSRGGELTGGRARPGSPLRGDRTRRGGNPLPGWVGGGFSSKKFPDLVHLGKGRAKEVNRVAASDQLLRQVNRLGGPAPRRRIKRFVGQKGEAH